MTLSLRQKLHTAYPVEFDLDSDIRSEFGLQTTVLMYLPWMTDEQVLQVSNLAENGIPDHDLFIQEVAKVLDRQIKHLRFDNNCEYKLIDMGNPDHATLVQYFSPSDGTYLEVYSERGVYSREECEDIGSAEVVSEPPAETFIPNQGEGLPPEREFKGSLRVLLPGALTDRSFVKGLLAWVTTAQSNAVANLMTKGEEEDAVVLLGLLNTVLLGAGIQAKAYHTDEDVFYTYLINMRHPGHTTIGVVDGDWCLTSQVMLDKYIEDIGGEEVEIPRLTNTTPIDWSEIKSVLESDQDLLMNTDPKVTRALTAAAAAFFRTFSLYCRTG